MAKIVNLNRARRSRARQQARDDADRNAVLHGLPKAEKLRARAEAEREARKHSDSRIERPDVPVDDRKPGDGKPD